MTMEPLEKPTDAPPTPWKTSAFRLTVPELLAFVVTVLLAAEAVTVPTPKEIVLPLDEAESAPVTDRLVRSGPCRT